MNVIEIIVRAKDDATKQMAGIVSSFRGSGQKAGQGFSAGFTRAAGGGQGGILSGLFGNGSNAGTAGQRAGQQAGTGFLKGFRAAIGGLGGGKSGGGGLDALNAGGVAGGALPGMMGVSGKHATMLGIGGSLLGALPALAAVSATTGLLGAGGSVISMGAKQLIGQKNTAANPNAQGPLFQQAQAIQKSFQEAMKGAAGAMLGPLKQAFNAIPGLIKSIAPGLKAMFAGAGSMIMPLVTGLGSLAKSVLPLLGQAFRAVAPLITPLLSGLGALLKGVLPALVTLLKAAHPAIAAFASVLGALGKGIGGMLSGFAPALKASAVIFKALGDVVAALFPIVGKLATTLATALAPVFGVLAGVIKSLLPVLTPLINVLASFAGAVLTDLVGVLGAVGTLLKDIAPSFATLAKVAGQVFNTMENSGVFAIMGDALENIAPVLAKFINLLIKQLAPFLPTLMNLVSQLANILITLLSAGLTAILTGLTKLLQHFPQLVPVIAGVVAGWMTLNAVMAINPFVAIGLAIVVLVGIVVKYHKQIVSTIVGAWNTVKSFLDGIWNDLPKPLRDALKAYGDMWKAEWDVMLGSAKIAWAIISGVLKVAWDNIAGIAKAVWAGIAGGLKAIWAIISGSFKVTIDLLTGNWSGAMNAIRNTGTQVWNAIKGALTGIWNALKGSAEQTWNAMKGAATSAWNAMKAEAVQVWNTIKSAVGAVWNAMKSTAAGVWNAIKGDASGLWSALKTGFSGVVSGIATAWNKLTGIFKAPVNFMINTVYMGGIRRVWDDVMNFLGLNSLDLPAVQGLATGGKLPGYGGGDQHLRLLESGEAVVDKDRTRKYAPLLAAMGVPGMAKGGIVGDAIDLGKMSLAAVSGNVTAFDNAFIDLMGGGKSGGGAAGHYAALMATLPVDMAKKAIGGIWHKITAAAKTQQTAASGGAGGTNSGGPGGGAPSANAALARKMYPKWSQGAYWDAWNKVAMRESGWNSLAHNPGGAFGIAQALGHGVSGGGGKYGNQYGGFGLSLAGDRNANNGQPAAQIQWMANYMSSIYGGPIGAWNKELSSGFYANGGATSAGWAVVGERGRELIKVPGGSTVYPHGAANSMLTPSGGGVASVQLEISAGGQSAFEAFMLKMIREQVRVKGGGSVQKAFGVPGK